MNSMKTLVIEQKTAFGHRKTWKITPAESPAVFGSSRLAHIISQDPHATPFEGVFEFKDENWVFCDLHKDRLENSLTTRIQSGETLKFPHSELKITVIQKNESLSDILDRAPTAQGTNAGNSNLDYQIYIIRHKNRVLETQVLPKKQKFKSRILGSKTSVALIVNHEWTRQSFGVYELSQRSLQLKDIKDLAQFQAKDFLDPESRKSSLAILASCIIVGILFLLSPQEKTDYTPPSLPKVAQKIVVKNEPVRKKPEEKKSKEPNPQARTPAAIPPSQNPSLTTGTKVAHLLKNFQEGRISTLLGKVSAQAAKSKNIIVSGGVPAGTAPSGPALSALGPVDRSGKDWATDAKGAGVSVNTIGKGGGKSTEGLGTLSGGKVGSGGVGLIEDESEITGGLDREVIAEYIKTQLGQILYCYERQLSAKPNLFGKVAVKFEIGPTGAVSTSKIGDTTLKDNTVEGCILNKINSWKFPTPKGGTRVMVTYPFLFKSTN